MLPVHIRIKVGAVKTHQLCRAVDVLLSFFKKKKTEICNKHVHSRKIPCLLGFYPHSQVTLDFIHCSRVEYILVKMGS